MTEMFTRHARLGWLIVSLWALSGEWLQAALYPKIEASFTINAQLTDPYDYTSADVQVVLAQPDGTSITLPAFFTGGLTWHVRHSPPLPGLYRVASASINGYSLSTASFQPSSWNVAGRPLSPGFVRVDPASPSRFITADGRRYFPVGEDLAWDVNSTTTVKALMARLGAAHENWARIWMDHWDGKNLDWPKLNGNFGVLSQTVAQKWDAIVDAADQAGVSFQMTLQHHGQYSSTVDPNWPDNPYNAANGGFLTNAVQFFTDPTAKALTKRKLRYSIARWGYSPSIMAWELFNEVQFTDAGQAGQWSVIGAWHDEMAQFIRSQDPYHHLITTSSDVTQPIWNQCDFYTHHDYPTDLISVLHSPPEIPAGQPIKPIYGAESGSDLTPYYGIGAPLWAGLMGGQSGATDPWYWDRIDAEGDYGLLLALSDFVRRAGIAEQDGLAPSTVHVNSGVLSSLVFSPGGSWSTASQDTFTVGDDAPNGIGSLPSFLQGNYHRGMTPNGFSFIVNYPASGTFAVQIVTVAACGAALRLTVDNITTNLITFPYTGADQNTNLTLSISVPAGQHTVRLWNPGQDWVNLGNLTLNPYASILGGYELVNTNFVAAWVWHRTNIYNPSATLTVNGTLPVAGLLPGNYSATWWDTYAGVALSNFTFAVSGTNSVNLLTPPLLRSLAFFAGPAPKADFSLNSVDLQLTSNSPASTVPLTIANSGGLPLAYSLSITGANAVAYSAVDSTQTGGPTFAWKDISGVGRDLSGSFSALTSKAAGDEGIAGPIPLGFSFPFFSGAQTQSLFNALYLSPNGFVSFSPFAGDTSVNSRVPSASAPTNSIALFWDDLALGSAGKVYAFSDALNSTFTLQFQNVPVKNAGGAAITCQLILKSSGEIVMQYQTLGVINTCTVGLQNAAGNQGLQVAFNQNYLQTNFAVRITPLPWLSLSGNGGLVPKGSAEAINLTLNPAGLAPGTYHATLLANTPDPSPTTMAIPVSLTVLTPLEQWRVTNFGITSNTGVAADAADPDGDGWLNIFEYAFGTNPNRRDASLISYALVNGHLTATFKRPHPAPWDISYGFETTANPVEGPWQSGVGATSQTITDNLNGTETVTVTDAASAFSSPAHYFRIRIAHP